MKCCLTEGLRGVDVTLCMCAFVSGEQQGDGCLSLASAMPLFEQRHLTAWGKVLMQGTNPLLKCPTEKDAASLVCHIDHQSLLHRLLNQTPKPMENIDTEWEGLYWGDFNYPPYFWVFFWTLMVAWPMTVTQVGTPSGVFSSPLSPESCSLCLLSHWQVLANIFLSCSQVL